VGFFDEPPAAVLPSYLSAILTAKQWAACGDQRPPDGFVVWRSHAKDGRGESVRELLPPSEY
jgi:hypothetical protein